MRKLIITLSLLLALLVPCTPHAQITFAAQSPIYYRVTGDSVILYRTPEISDDTANAYFLLQSTYFVEQLEDVNETLLKVNYMGITGYVQKSDLTRVYQTPVSPFPENITFSILKAANVVIREGPTTQSEPLGIIPFNAENVKYMGSLYGEEAMENLGGLWYYATYFSYEQGAVTGYVYAPLTTGVAAIPQNTEVLATTSPSTGSEVISPELKEPANIFLIIGLCVPALLLLFLLFKPEKRSKKSRARVRNVAHQEQLPYTSDRRLQRAEREELDF